MRALGIFLILFFGVQVVFAQYYGAIQVDQPGFSNGFSTVKKYRFQIESRMAYQQDSKFPNNPNLEQKRVQFATTLMRFGVSKTLELRLGSGFLYQRDKNLEVKSSLATVQGIALGGKWNFLKHKTGLLPNASFLLQADLPVGSKRVVSKFVEPQFALLASHPLSDAARLGYNLALKYRDNREMQYFYALSLQVDFSPQTTAFVELSDKYSKSEKDAMYFDGGLNLLIKRNFITYIYGGKGLNTQAADWFISAGMGVRLPR